MHSHTPSQSSSGLAASRAIKSTGFVSLEDLDLIRSTSVLLCHILSIEEPSPSSRDIVPKFLSSSERIKEKWRSMLCIDSDDPYYINSIEPFTDETSAISKSNHLVARTRCGIDIFYGISLREMLYPALLIEIVSGYENKQPGMQLSMKLLVLVAYLAELCWKDGVCFESSDDRDIPTSATGLVLPDVGRKGPILKITISWNPIMQVFQQKFEYPVVRNQQELVEVVCQVMEENESVVRFLLRRVFLGGVDAGFQGSWVYRFNSAQLRELNSRMGGAYPTVLRQYPAREALVFARMASAESSEPIQFLKTSRTLASRVEKIAALVEDKAVLSQFLVLPENGEKFDVLGLKIGRRRYFSFPAYRPFENENSIFDHFASVVECVAYLHEVGIGHNDVRPANMVWDGNRARLIDLDRITEADDIFDSVGLGSIWYPSGMPATDLDWHQLGISLISACLHKTSLDMLSQLKEVAKSKQSFVHELLFYLLVKNSIPPEDKRQIDRTKFIEQMGLFMGKVKSQMEQQRLANVHNIWKCVEVDSAL
eukprot:Rmarinus@m.15176